MTVRVFATRIKFIFFQMEESGDNSEYSSKIESR